MQYALASCRSDAAQPRRLLLQRGEAPGFPSPLRLQARADTGLPEPSADACTALLLVLSLSQLNIQVLMVEARKKAADAFWLSVAPFTSERAQGDRSWEQCS